MFCFLPFSWTPILCFLMVFIEVVRLNFMIKSVYVKVLLMPSELHVCFQKRHRNTCDSTLYFVRVSKDNTSKLATGEVGVDPHLHPLLAHFFIVLGKVSSCRNFMAL